MAEPAAPPARGLRRYWPAGLLAVAAVAALTHMAPFWATQRATPTGWEFTGNLTGSPDEMQYRILMERSQVVGPIVENRLTTEPNRPHIAMYFYYGIGRLAHWFHARPAYAAAYAGMVLAALLALGTFWIVDHFLASRYQTWWVYLALLFGGGLGAHLMLLNDLDVLRGNTLFGRIVSDGLRNAIVFEEYRSHYLFTTLFDTHFLFFLCTALLAIVAFYRAVAGFTVPRLLAAGLAFGAATALHIYDGVTLVFIAAGVVAVLRLRGLPVRHALITLAVSAAAAGAAILWQMLLYRNSGLRIPDWRAQSIYASELALAYPLAWGLIVWGLGRYWQTAGLKECFLLGWILGCTVLTLSGPFYPYPDRGTLTLQIPLMIVAGAIYFSWRPRVAPHHALVAVALLAATPIWQVKRLLTNMSFSHHPSGAPPAYTWMSPAHQELLAALRRHATEDDVLIVDKSRVPWRTDDLWLTQGFPGRLYAGHYALTPDYARKRDEVNAFFAEPDPVKGAEFLRRAGVTVVFVRQDQEPARFEAIPGLRRLAANSVGTLFAYTPPEP